jgi:hypothetical protein
MTKGLPNEIAKGIKMDHRKLTLLNAFKELVISVLRAAAICLSWLGSSTPRFIANVQHLRLL